MLFKPHTSFCKRSAPSCAPPADFETAVLDENRLKFLIKSRNVESKAQQAYDSSVENGLRSLCLPLLLSVMRRAELYTDKANRIATEAALRDSGQGLHGNNYNNLWYQTMSWLDVIHFCNIKGLLRS